MREQNNRGTQYPTFCVYEKRRRWTNEYEEDVRKIRKEDADERHLCAECRIFADKGKELPEECEDCDSDAFDYYKDETAPAQWDGGGFFFTEKACNEYMESNAHHLDSPYSYVPSAYRNPEVIHIMQQILLLTGDDIPSCYQ